MTDVGAVRTQNQDSYCIDLIPEEKVAILVVCDGMGGHKAGNVASELAVTAFTREVRQELRTQMSAKQLERLARRALETANSEVHEKAREDESCSGMGTTLVACLLSGDNALVVNVGDSRAYRITESGIEQITQDHSVVEQLVERGEITKEEARTHPNKNLITRALGTGALVRGDFYPLKLKNGDHLLLCTDGVSNLLGDQELLYEVIHHAEKENCCRRILSIVAERGAPDNATVVLFQR